jgi:hypothetical protein
LRDIITQIFALVVELRRRFPGKRFTPGDKLIGDTGETLAEKLFDLEPLGDPKSHDFRCCTTKLKVQVKTTSGESVGLGLKKEEFQHLLVFKLYAEGDYELLYDGPGAPVWKATENKKGNSIRVNKLRELQAGHEIPLPRKQPKALSV